MDERNAEGYQEKADVMPFTNSGEILRHYGFKPFAQTIQSQAQLGKERSRKIGCWLPLIESTQIPVLIGCHAHLLFK